LTADDIANDPTQEDVGENMDEEFYDNGDLPAV
jgi:hypothetical protein